MEDRPKPSPGRSSIPNDRARTFASTNQSPPGLDGAARRSSPVETESLVEHVLLRRPGSRGLERIPPVLEHGREVERLGALAADRLEAPKPAPCARQRRALILNHMVQHSRATQLDAAFAALSDATRRGVLEQLGRADASITDLAERFDMTLTGMKKHVGVLEHAGLVATAKVGRVRTCTLGQRRLDEVTAWIDRYRQLWSARFDELDQVIEELKQKEKERAPR